jgi:hypothetical protein
MKIAEVRGKWVALAAVVADIALNLFAIGLNYITLDGIVHSFILLSEDRTPIIFLSPFGNIGGWLPMAFIILIFQQTFAKSLVREGEYLQLKTICENFVSSLNQSDDPQILQECYSDTIQLLDSFNARCLFSKNVVKRQIMALNCLKNIPKVENKSKLEKTIKLEAVLKKIDTELENKLSLQKCFTRVSKARKVIQKKGCLTGVMAVVFGIAIPIIFLACSVLSIVGDVGLGTQVFYNRTALSETSHVAEWVVNAIVFVSAAYLLHRVYIQMEGDLHIAKKVYDKELNNLNDSALHNRLASVAKKEIAEMSSVCHYIKYPHEIKFKKL